MKEIYSITCEKGMFYHYSSIAQSGWINERLFLHFISASLK